ncbi:MAG: site-specific integrase [Clostridiales bacterium]|nr:site-specific integrase [Clostridiales bacterium]
MANIRRDKGDGSLRRRPNGSWEGRFSFTDDYGKRVTKSVYAPTQGEAKRKLRDLILNIGMDKDQDLMASDLLVGEWLDTWMKEYKKNSVRPATYASYHQNIETHIRPSLGNMELRQIRPLHIQTLLNEMATDTRKRKAYAPWTVQKVKIILSGAFEQAVRNQLIAANPVRSAVAPKMGQKEIRILTEQEQRKFIEACKGHRLEALYTLALATGMRRGEILALTWDCINFSTKSISVKSSVLRVKDPDTQETRIIFSEPKTKAGRRTVPILENLVPALQAHKERQDAEKTQAGSAWNERDLVFCSNVGTVIEPRRVRQMMDKISDKAGIEHVTFHALRHTFATRMLEAEVPAKIVQDILGHSDVTLTLNTYSHVMGTTAHEQIAKIDSLFSKTNTEKPSIKQQLLDAKKESKSPDKEKDMPRKTSARKAAKKDSRER